MIREMHHLNARDPHTDMCRLDHAHVIRAIANSEKNSLLVLLHQLHNECFLERRNTTCKGA